MGCNHCYQTICCLQPYQPSHSAIVLTTKYLNSPPHIAASRKLSEQSTHIVTQKPIPDNYRDKKSCNFCRHTAAINLDRHSLHLHPMKFFAFIMAVLVLALSVMPCADNGNAMYGGKAKTQITKQSQQDDNHNDACSPFCTCSCCAGFSVNHFVASVTTIPKFTNHPASRFLPSEIIEVALPIWQPPQLV